MAAVERKIRVLVVGHGDGEVQEALVAVGENAENVSVRVAETTDRAREVLDDERVDCLVDGRVTGDGRIQFLSAMREESPDLPYLFVTDDPALADDALDAGVTDVAVRHDAVDDRRLLERRLDGVLGGEPCGDHEQRLVAERQATDRLLDSLDDIFYMLDADGNLVRWNETLEEATGYSEAELDGMHALEFFAGDHQERVADAIAEALNTGSVTVEAEVATKDGGRVPIEYTGTKLVDEDGRPYGIVGIGRNITERRERERELERERDRMAATLDAAPYPFAHVRFDGSEPVVKQVNDAFEAVFGYDEQELRGESLDDYIVSADTDTATELNERTRDGESVEQEVVRETADGEQRDFLFKSTPLTREDGSTEGIGTYVDITERKERIEKLDQLRRHVSEVVWMSDPEKESMDFISDSYEDIWGRTPESLREEPGSFVDAIHPEDRERVEEALATQQEHPDSYEETYRVVQPDGELRWVHDRASGIYEDGTLTRIVGVASDITERKERERELELKNRAMDEAPIGITIHNASADGPITYVNDGFVQLTGYSHDAVRGETFGLFAGTETNETRLRELRRAFDGGKSLSVVLLLYRRNGQPFWAKVSLAPVTDESGRVAHFVGFLQDITDTKEHEQEVARRLDEFGEVLAEDLRTPLQDATEKLRAAQESGDAGDIEAAMQSLEHVDKLVDDLTTVHKRSVKPRDTFEPPSRDGEGRI